MPQTQYETVKETLPRFCSEVEYFTAKMIKAEANGTSTGMYDAYIRGYCTAMKDAGIFSEAQAWADECRKRLLAKGGAAV